MHAGLCFRYSFTSDRAHTAAVAGHDRFDPLTKLRQTAHGCRRMKRSEPHLAGMWENVAATIDRGIAEIERLRRIVGETVPGDGISTARRVAPNGRASGPI